MSQIRLYWEVESPMSFKERSSLGCSKNVLVGPFWDMFYSFVWLLVIPSRTKKNFLGMSLKYF